MAAKYRAAMDRRTATTTTFLIRPVGSFRSAEARLFRRLERTGQWQVKPNGPAGSWRSIRHQDGLSADDLDQLTTGWRRAT